MEQENFDAKLAKLNHDIEQLSAEVDDKISSLREELRKWILVSYLAHIRDVSEWYINILRLSKSGSSAACDRAFDEVEKFGEEQVKMVSTTPADDFEKNVLKFRERINMITRAAGLGEIWQTPKAEG